jgi:hypothetical protein
LTGKIAGFGPVRLAGSSVCSEARRFPSRSLDETGQEMKTGSVWHYAVHSQVPFMLVCFSRAYEPAAIAS